ECRCVPHALSAWLQIFRMSHSGRCAFDADEPQWADPVFPINEHCPTTGPSAEIRTVEAEVECLCCQARSETPGHRHRMGRTEVGSDPVSLRSMRFFGPLIRDWRLSEAIGPQGCLFHVEQALFHRQTGAC